MQPGYRPRGCLQLLLLGPQAARFVRVVRHVCQLNLNADQPGSIELAVFLQPVRVNQPRPIVVEVGKDGCEQRRLLDHGLALLKTIILEHIMAP